MVARTGRLLFSLAAWLLAVLTILAALLVWRVATGPLALDVWHGYVERALVPADGSLEVTIGRSALAWGGLDHPIEVRAFEVTVSDADGRPLALLPELSIAFGLEALIRHGVLAPVAIEAQAPEVRLVREADGRIGLVLPEAGIERPYPDEERPGVMRAVIDELLAPPDPSRPLGQLDSVHLVGGRVVIEDRITGGLLELPWLDVTLSRGEGTVRGQIEALLAQDEGPARIAIEGGYGGLPERADLVVDVTGFWPTTLDPWLDERHPKLAMPISGRLRGTVGPEGPIGSIAAELVAGAGVVEAPGLLTQPLELDHVRLRGRIDAGARRLDLDELYAARGEAVLSAAGSVRLDDDGLEILLDAEADGIEVADLDLYWPDGRAPNARAWVAERITAGRARDAEVRVHLRPGDLAGGPLPADAIDGRFRFEGVELHSAPPLPPVEGGAGRARFDAGGLVFDVEAGGAGDILVDEGRVVISGLDVPDGARLEIDVLTQAPLAEALALIGRPPLSLLAATGLDPAGTSGDARARLGFGLPLRAGVDIGELEVTVEAWAEDVAIRDLVPGIDVAGAHARLEVRDDVLTLDGAGSFAGLSLSVRLEQALAGTRERRVDLEGIVPAHGLQAVGVDLADRIGGDLGLSASLRTRPGEPQFLDLDVDLTAATVHLREIGWAKTAGAPGRLEAAVTFARDGPALIESFGLAGPGLAASGRGALDLEPPGIRTLELLDVRHEDSQLSARIEQGGGETLIELSGPRLDLRPVLAEIDRQGLDAWLDRVPVQGRVRTRLAVDELRLDDDGGLLEVYGELVSDDGVWRPGELHGRLPGGGSFRLALSDDDGPLELRLSADDAGALLRALGQGRSVEGGLLDLRALVAKDAGRAVARGELAIDEFTLRDAPGLARLLTLASLTGIRQALEGGGIWFDRLHAPFALGEGRVAIEGARIAGSQLGLTADGVVELEAGTLDISGTLVPLYTLNRAIAGIPLLGRLLRGAAGEGAFAATYAVRGERDSPEIRVNPLSMLAPGFLRDLFAGVIPPDDAELPSNRD